MLLLLHYFIKFTKFCILEFSRYSVLVLQFTHLYSNLIVIIASIDRLSVSVFIYTFASACSFLTSGFSFLNKHFGYISTHVLTRTCLAIEGVLTELTYCLPQRIVGKSEHWNAHLIQTKITTSRVKENKRKQTIRLEENSRVHSRARRFC